MMTNENTTLKELYAKYSKPNMTREERQELMDKIARERYKLDKRKPITQKGQALSNLICGIVIILEAVFGTFGKKLIGETGVDVFFILAIITVVVLAALTSRYKKEPADELAKELMTKAAAYSAYVPIALITLIGIVMHLNGNRTDHEIYEIRGDHVLTLALLLMGIQYVVRYGMYLWLDRTPKSEDEEE